MPKRDENLPQRSWTKPEVRRIATGSAGSGGDTAVDGSANLS
ncbi:MAG TPA: hypothetical protein VE053_05605 [Allosphingosinicella sp.]|nr:hypothetical protein [Allosphingosinicella sp.]